MKKVSVVAKIYNVSVRTLHHYDEIGLIVPMRQGNVRLYSQDDEITLKRILLFKDLGFTLREIKGLMNGKIAPDVLGKKRDALILKRDRMNEVITYIDALSVSDHEVQDVIQLLNPFGLKIRNKIGDKELNAILNTGEINASDYTSKLNEIVLTIKRNIKNRSLLLMSIKEYHNYFTEWLHLEINRRDFELMIVERISDFELDVNETRSFIKALNTYGKS